MAPKFGIISESLGLVAMASLAIALLAGPSWSAGPPSDSGSPAVVAAATVPEPAAQGSPAVQKSLKTRVKAALQKVNPIRLLRDRQFKTAAAEFPAFCKDWERKLHDREVNNQNHIAWQQKDGWATGTYTGYTSVQKCECHQSSDGYSIGKVTYDELKYYIVGKTTDEAKHAKPRVTDDTATTELFRWDKEKWFY